jgi:crossover junction endodeoxyribonuclease RusA
MNSWKYTIPGQPLVQERPRLGRHGNFYSPSSRDQKAVGTLLLAQRVANGRAPLTGDLEMSAIFYYRKAGKRKYDLSNMVKFIEDAANGILYQDDNQIVSLFAKKIAVETGERTDVILSSTSE